MKLVLRASLFCVMPIASVSAAEEDLEASPVVTAQAWAVAAHDSGKVLWSANADEKRKSASTTKMMCAYTVLKLVEADPAVLEERVTFSKLAADTVGSSAEVKVGESMSVKDCLYGLMLPSGNDAGNALAEHFNKRCAPPDTRLKKLGLSNPILSTRVNFIAEMNRHAAALGMSDTVYRSSFGDGGTEQDRTTTATDLCKLAATAMKIETFRELAKTTEYRAVIRQDDGRTREMVWKNSNPLLQLDLGYDGIKTGMTHQAGHCLVVSAQHHGRRLIIVVLGCVSEETRTADVRNLARWAWQQ
jgi:serine-type D-Ala-D-Ala carboxypeptidase (penicillin-binding protein 5/6)